MNLTDWLAAEKGRASALAQHFDVTPAAVSQWKQNGVPVKLMKSVRDFTGGTVTLEEMVPESAPKQTEPAKAA
jgi:DNA-binding transcriptional regulator YdaS (Cro superfamily)